MIIYVNGHENHKLNSGSALDALLTFKGYRVIQNENHMSYKHLETVANLFHQLSYPYWSFLLLVASVQERVVPALTIMLLCLCFCALQSLRDAK